MRRDLSDLHHATIDDILYTFIGPMIGEGISRRVFVFAYDETKVVKIEHEADGRFQNVAEWKLWEEAAYTEIGKWLAPCYMISPCGRLLIQARTKPLGNRRPDKVPAIFTDLKAENWGVWRGRIVAHDYGLNRAISRSLTKQMRKVDFWA